MPERRVRVTNRGVYGRAEPLRAPRRRTVRSPTLSPWQWRAIVLLLGLGVVVWGLSKMFSVTHISVAAPAEKVRLQAELQELVAKSWWSRNLVTVNVDEMESKLQQADPIIKTVTINRQWPHALAATITLKQPSLGWSSGNQFYLVDVDGGAIGQLPPASKLPVVYDGSNLPVKTGDQVVSGRFVQFVTKLPAALSAQGLTATRFEVGETTLDLTVHTNKGFRLLFDTSRPVEEGTHDLAAVQKTLATQKKVPAEYIDLRIKGKAYYK